MAGAGLAEAMKGHFDRQRSRATPRCNGAGPTGVGPVMERGRGRCRRPADAPASMKDPYKYNVKKMITAPNGLLATIDNNKRQLKEDVLKILTKEFSTHGFARLRVITDSNKFNPKLEHNSMIELTDGNHTIYNIPLIEEDSFIDYHATICDLLKRYDTRLVEDLIHGQIFKKNILVAYGVKSMKKERASLKEIKDIIETNSILDQKVVLKKKNIFIYPARFSERKNHIKLIKAFKGINNAVLIASGRIDDIEYFEKVKKEIVENRMLDKVFLMYPVAHKKLLKLMSKSDFVVFPSFNACALIALLLARSQTRVLS